MLLSDWVTVTLMFVKITSTLHEKMLFLISLYHVEEYLFMVGFLQIEKAAKKKGEQLEKTLLSTKNCAVL